MPLKKTANPEQPDADEPRSEAVKADPDVDADPDDEDGDEEDDEWINDIGIHSNLRSKLYVDICPSVVLIPSKKKRETFYRTLVHFPPSSLLSESDS